MTRTTIDHHESDGLDFDLTGFEALADGIRKHTRSGGGMQQSVIDFDRARQERDAGMDRAIEHAERVDDSWPVVAYNFLCRYAHAHEYFDAWEVTAEAQRLGYGAPTTDKAWGSIFVKAVRNEIIEAWGVGRNPNRHASICIRYRSNVYSGSVA